MHPAKLWENAGNNSVQCRLCNHFCHIEPEEYGKCGVRTNKDGHLYTLVYDRVAALNLDPVEKKPLFHFYPGTYTLSLGTMGCNFFCQFCQNSTLSQSPKQKKTIYGEKITPEQIVQSAQHYGAQSISYTYSEPTIFFELVYDSIKLAKQKGLKNILVSNGFMSPKCLQELGPYVDAINIDLKAFTEKFYQDICGTKLKPVLQNLKKTKDLGWWLEVTTLIIPELNDSEEELRQLVSFLYNELGPEVPWHVSRFHPSYKMIDYSPTPLQTLEMAFNIGKQIGLNYIYLGNVPGHQTENTVCPFCHSVVIERSGFSLKKQNIKNNHCFHCGTKIAGIGLG